jgi:hypothetical protein
MKENKLIKKNSIIGHLTIRLGIPFFVFFLLWQVGDIKNGSLEELLFFSIFYSVLLFVISIFLLRETIYFHRDKRLLLRNINCFLLIFFIPAFLFLAISSVALANF